MERRALRRQEWPRRLDRPAGSGGPVTGPGADTAQIQGPAGRYPVRDRGQGLARYEPVAPDLLGEQGRHRGRISGVTDRSSTPPAARRRPSLSGIARPASTPPTALERLRADHARLDPDHPGEVGERAMPIPTKEFNAPPSSTGSPYPSPIEQEGDPGAVGPGTWWVIPSP